MTPERWQQINQVFDEALAQPAAERAAFLTRACAGDAKLRRRVEAMLAADAQTDLLLDRPAQAAAAELFSAETSATQESEILSGHTIGSYRLLHEIGRGGMGKVYLARDERLDRRLALKLLPARLTGDASRVARFQREARAASALNHPNILTIYDFGQDANRHYIASEYVEGQTLRDLLNEGNLTPMQALDVAAQVASALAAAHQAGIVHRDIKPENVMLRPDGYVKVLDFGLAKLTEVRSSTDDAATLASGDSGFETRTGMVLGTVSYMSPEQASGQKVDARTDLFSLGVVLYEMVTGHRPFEGRTRNHLLVAILDAEPPPLSSYLAAPPQLESIINRALRKDREQRYQTAKDLLADLSKLKQDLELQARLRSNSTEESQAKARTRAGSVAAAVATSNAARFADKIKLDKKADFMLSAALVVALVAVAFWIYRPPTPSKLAAPFQTVQPVRITTLRKALAATISPDGKYVAYVTRRGKPSG
jgi:serine/threonine protein kinase